MAVLPDGTIASGESSGRVRLWDGATGTLVADFHEHAADVTLSPDVLDRIDEIVPPGTNLSAVDAGWTNPMLASERRRRRRA